MITIGAESVDVGLTKTLMQLNEFGVKKDRGFGETIELAVPFTFTLFHPNRRWLTLPGRNANPFFFWNETIALMMGATEAQMEKSLKEFLPRIEEFRGMSWDYGYRWRHHFHKDQIEETVNLLTDQKNTRQAVIAIWDGRDHFTPCNLEIMFQTNKRDGVEYLDAYVNNRSNDVVWGMWGANVVHFTTLQQYMAERVGLNLGHYHVYTKNAHIYPRHYHFLDKELLNKWWLHSINESSVGAFSHNPIASGSRFLKTAKPERIFHQEFLDNEARMSTMWEEYKKGSRNIPVSVTDLGLQRAVMEFLRR